MSETKMPQETDGDYLSISEKHEAFRYRRIEHVVQQMGGWANFRYWLNRHAAEYFKTCMNLKEREAKLLNEIECLNAELKNKSLEIGRSEHRGNTVDYIYDKCRLYGEQIEAARVREAKLKAQLEKAIEQRDSWIKLCFENEPPDNVFHTENKVIAEVGK